MLLRNLRLTSPHWQKCLAAFHWSFWFLLLPTIGDRPLDRPLLVIFTWWPFIHSGQLPRLQRWTNRAHSRKREARATTGASWKNQRADRDFNASDCFWGTQKHKMWISDFYQVQSGGKDGGVRYGSRLAAVQEELEALHALSNGAQIHHVLVLHGLLTGCQSLLETVGSWGRVWTKNQEGGEERRGEYSRTSEGNFAEK